MDQTNGAAAPSVNRAERFEDEKRRIIETCFSKKDTDGSLLETYITHIRITEFSSHPTTPPPPQARTPHSEKPRVIIVAVRKSGRVRMHKSKENSNGSFSIGKTWNIDDLSHVESYTGPQVPSDQREWAGNTGFLVSLGKPYYWQAQTDKEKKFFIASLIKIYGKYTGGRIPELTGFEQRELDQVLGAGRRTTVGASGANPTPIPNTASHALPAVSPSLPLTGQPPGAPPPPPGQSLPTPPASRPSQQHAGSFQSNRSAYSASNAGSINSEAQRARKPSHGQSPARSPARTPLNGSPAGTPSGTPAGSVDATFREQRPGRPWMSQNNRSQDSLTSSIGARSEDAHSRPPRSRNGLPENGARGRLGDPAMNGPPPVSPDVPRLPSLAQEAPRLPPLSQDSSRLPSSSQDAARLPALGQEVARPSLKPVSSDDSRPASSRSNKDAVPPERRRPPMDPSRPLDRDRDLVPPPLMSPAGKRDPMAPPPRSMERVLQRKLSAGQSITGQQSETSSITGSMMEKDMALPTMASIENMRTSTAKSETPSVAHTNQSMPNTRASSPTIHAEKAPTTNEESMARPPIPAIPSDVAAEEGSRPGLGPMIKAKKSKGDIAGAFWKAASAANAFKPRPGGAGERLRLAQATNKVSDEPDGITGVVPAPPRPLSRDAKSKDNLDTPKVPEAVPSAPPVPGAVAAGTEPSSIVPEVKVSNAAGQPTAAADPVSDGPKKEEQPPEKSSRRSVVSGNDAKYLQALGIPTTFLDGKAESFSHWLDHFGWVPGEQMRSRHVDDMKVEVERELSKAQAGGWLSRFREEDERVEAIKRGLDVAMDECEELDNLLTLYSVELSTLAEDIAYIEAQGQGLQVQTNNQKLLKKELESLLETCAITDADLQPLALAPFDNMHGLQDIETALVTLFKAMSKMDPSLGGEAEKSITATMNSDRPNGLHSDFSGMKIVRDKRSMYETQSLEFMQRLESFMRQHLDLACAETKKTLDGALSKKVDATHHNAGRDLLWKYSPLMLYARDAHLEDWNRLILLYQEKSHPLYRQQFQSVVAVWRRNARKLTGEEAELLFSYQQEKKDEGVATTARKLTVKRSQTLAKALRSPLADNHRPSLEKSGSLADKSMPYEVFAGVLHDLLPLIEMEQNFIVDFFHASTLEQVDFPDAVAACPPRDRQGGDLKRHRLMEPDRELARRVTRAMEVIFAFLESDLQRLMEWVVGQDPLQGIGVLVILEKKMADYGQSNQDFINTMLQRLHSNLEIRFRKFVDEQVRAIEDTKVKISKRKGVISFIRVFPTFSTAVENMMAGVDPHLEIRRTTDHEYDRILRTMFDSLQVIARENPAMATASGGDTLEDKEALNFHILLIENMNHFIEETDTRGLQILEEWRDQAQTQYDHHMDLYLNAAMRRPLGKLLDYLENIEAQRQAGKLPSAIAAQPSNSKNVFNKVLGNYDSKEVRKGIEVLRKRVDKHFGDADDPALSRSLVIKVQRECERFYADVEGRIGRVTTDLYGGDVLFEWPRADVKAAFR